MSDVWKDKMPPFLDQMIRYMKEKDMNEVGFLRLKGSDSEVEKLIKTIEEDPSKFKLMGDKDNNVKVLDIEHTFSVTQLFKKFLSSIKNNVIPVDVCQKIRTVESEFKKKKYCLIYLYTGKY